MMFGAETTWINIVCTFGNTAKQQVHCNVSVVVVVHIQPWTLFAEVCGLQRMSISIAGFHA